MYPTDLTVAAVIEHENRYLLVEEYSMGNRVFTQPGGHIESGESPEEAVERETLEESGCEVRCEDLIGVYLWIHPQTRQQFLRLVYAARYLDYLPDAPIDPNIIGRRWFSLQDLEDRKKVLRSPAVLRCVKDYAAGIRQSDALLTGMLPLQQNVHRILAAADLV
ncbi:MAG: NUDIX domain-containing protein [Gammaproteobacteria bacterium]|jgi:ADP-ribose pyrophosphatase YjhB (NUDIX family)|nr:NUDIX domain-containing protein [Gammaproteobacteria bacterium]